MDPGHITPFGQRPEARGQRTSLMNLGHITVLGDSAPLIVNLSAFFTSFALALVVDVSFDKPPPQLGILKFTEGIWSFTLGLPAVDRRKTPYTP